MAEQASAPSTDVVQAAGGVVWRRGPQGSVEVLLVHRPKYDDWSLPKGKLDPGEDHRTAARREVEEETGLRCALGDELPSVSYADRHGRPKVVRYWAMTPEEGPGRFTPTDEIDEVRWVERGEVATLLSYERDAGIVDSLSG